MSETNGTNNAPAITESPLEPKAGVAIGTNGGFVTPEGMEPLPTGPDGKVDWSAAGFEVLVHTRKDPAVLEAVTLKSGKSVAMPVLAAMDSERYAKHIPADAIRAALDGNGLRVKGQDVARAYAGWLIEQKVAHLAWSPETKQLQEPYLTMYLQKVWARYTGIRLERAPAVTKVVERVVEKRVVPLMDGTTWERPAGVGDAEAVNDLRSSYLSALMDAGVPIAMATGMVEKVDFWKLAGLVESAEVEG